MVHAGVDVGSRTAKVVILKGDRMVGACLMSTGPDSAETSEAILRRGLESAGLSMDDVSTIVTTGYGRYIAPFPHKSITEIACHANGVHRIFPTCRTVLDMGGQDCKVIRLNGWGEHVNFVMNDKCAAGTGRFLEIAAKRLNVPLERLGALSLEAERAVNISSTCAVFAGQEVVAHRRRGVPLPEILAGLHEAVVERVFRLISRVGIERDFVVTGGIARNPGIVRRLERRVGIPLLIPPDPQYTGALGAAWFAREEGRSGREDSHEQTRDAGNA